MHDALTKQELNEMYLYEIRKSLEAVAHIWQSLAKGAITRVRVSLTDGVSVSGAEVHVEHLGFDDADATVTDMEVYDFEFDVDPVMGVCDRGVALACVAYEGDDVSGEEDVEFTFDVVPPHVSVFDETKTSSIACDGHVFDDAVVDKALTAWWQSTGRQFVIEQLD